MKREIGSSFYQLTETDKEFQVLHDNEIVFGNHVRFYNSGRSALMALFEEIMQNQDIETIWLPAYYCHNVLRFLQRNYDNIKLYYINPFNYERDFNFKRFAKQGDLIVLNNFFGLFDYKYNPKSTNRPVIIEDHSHAWLSPQSKNSKADYCISSVRKTYPIPGGGVTWQPRSEDQSNFYQKGTDKAMENGFTSLSQSLEKKRAFLKEGKGNKEDYLALLGQGEAFISESNSYVRPNAKLMSLLKTFTRLDPNPIKKKNLNYVLPRLLKSKHFKVLNRKGFAPFGLLVLFKDEQMFSNFKSHCIKHGVYPANLWPDNDLRTQWKYFFNIHIDFRYTTEDMDHLISVLNNWTNKNS